MSELDFSRPLALIALVVVPAALGWWWVGLAKGTKQARFISRANPSRPAYFSAALLAIAAAAAIVAAAQPRWGTERTEVPRVGAELVVVLDVSRSMDARDVTPSRLEAAKAAVLATLARLGGDRVGVAIFAGTGRLRFPLTGDLEAAGQVISSLETGAILVEGGSSASSGLELALSAFDFTRDAGRAVLLISDGDDLGADPAGAISRLRAAGVTLLVAGAGTATGATVPVFDPQKRVFVDKKDASGAPIITKLNEPFLRAAATAAGGRYLGNDLQVVPGSVAGVLASLERTRVEQRSTEIPIERFPIFAAIALGALVLASVSERLPTIGGRRAAAGGLALMALLLGGCAEEAFTVNEDARTAFEAGDSARAVDLFYQAQSLRPNDARIALNLASALNSAGRFEEASVAARRALASNDPAIRSIAHANLGHQQFGAKQLPAALQSFKQALLLNPHDAASQHDYEVVLRLLTPPPPADPDQPGGSPDPPSPGPGASPTPGPGGTPGAGQTPQPGPGTPAAGGTPGPGRPGGLEALEKQIAGIDAQVQALLRKSGNQPTTEEALEILRLLAERSRLAGLRDAFRGGDKPNDY